MKVSNSKCNRYTIERITNISQMTGELSLWLREFGVKAAQDNFGSSTYMETFDYLDYAINNLLWICRRDGRPVGAMLASIQISVFDPDLTILVQDSLYVPESGNRAAFLLLREFIDFGKSNAKHIITMTASGTNIKARSLEKLGFKELERHYRLEVK